MKNSIHDIKIVFIHLIECYYTVFIQLTQKTFIHKIVCAHPAENYYIIFLQHRKCLKVQIMIYLIKKKFKFFIYNSVLMNNVSKNILKNFLMT